MSNITRRNADPVFGAFLGDWDPFRVMDSLLRWEPAAAAMPRRSGNLGVGFAARFDVRETKEGYVFRADLPGVKEEDLDIAVTGNQLTVSGKREFEEKDEGDNYFVLERGAGSFSRSFALPTGADVEHVRAELKDGILTLLVPKKPEVQPRKITLGQGAKAQG